MPFNSIRCNRIDLWGNLNYFTGIVWESSWLVLYFLQIRGEGGNIQVLEQIGGPHLGCVVEDGLDEGAEEEGAEKQVCCGVFCSGR